MPTDRRAWRRRPASAPASRPCAGSPSDCWPAARPRSSPGSCCSGSAAAGAAPPADRHIRPPTKEITMTRRNRAAALAAAAVALGAVLVPSAAQAAPKRTPLYVSVLTPPAPVLGTDGRRHLAYELTLENDDSGGARADLQSVSVRARGGRSLLRLSGEQ